MLCRDVLGADRRSVLSKGHRLDADDAPALAAAGAIHIVWLDNGDVEMLLRCAWQRWRRVAAPTSTVPSSTRYG